MSTAVQFDSVRFTTKRQVDIPMWLRKQFHIERDTTAVVQGGPEGIFLQPATRRAIKKGLGLLKRGCKPKHHGSGEEWSTHKREKVERTEAKYASSTGSR